MLQNFREITTQFFRQNDLHSNFAMASNNFYLFRFFFFSAQLYREHCQNSANGEPNAGVQNVGNPYFQPGTSNYNSGQALPSFWATFAGTPFSPNNDPNWYAITYRV